MTTHKGKESVLYYLNTLFGAVFDTEIINSVATNFHYDVDKSSNYLLEMSSNINVSTTTAIATTKTVTNVKKKKKSPQHHNNPRKTSNSTKLQPSVSSNTIVLPKTTTRTANKSKYSPHIDKVIDEICKGYKVLILLRGCPGSGKSYLAKTIVQRLYGNLDNYHQHIFSTDDYFMKNLKYCYDSSRIQEAHEWNQQRTFHAMKSGYSPIIIDNTNVQMWEMKPYAMMAIDFGYIIEIIEPNTPWFFNYKQLTLKNQHNIPKEKIRDMLDRYDKNVTTNKLLSAYNLSYRNQRVPQYRLQPPLSFKFNQNTIVKSKSCSGISNQQQSRASSSSSSSSSSSTSSPNNDNINLMDFVEIKSDKSTKSESISGESSNVVDDILMCKIEDSTNLLIPTTAKQNLFEDLENAWGIDEKALQSWDIVQPIKSTNQTGPELDNNCNNSNNNDDKVTIENSTMTDFNDFNYLENYKKQQLPNGYRLIDATSRDLNGKILQNHYEMVPKKVLMLDKSCLTDEQIDDRDDDVKLQHLKELFTSIPRSYLKELFNKCNKDFDWVVELLLSDNQQHHQQQEQQTESDDDDDDDNNDDSNDPKDDPTETIIVEESKQTRQKLTAQESEELKKLIEGKVDINHEHYSEHVLRVKQQKFGCLPSTSSAPSPPPQLQPDDDDDDDDDDDELESDFDSDSELNPKDVVELNLGEQLVQQLQMKFGGDDLLLPQGFQPIVQVPIDLARQLYVLHMESVCQQMEAQNSILANLVKEDEEFAKKLQQQEDMQQQQQLQQSMNFTEIMEEQAIARQCERDNQQWKNMSVDTLAAKLTKQKLFETFPNVDRNVLLEVLHAYNNDFYKTVEDLCSSFGCIDIKSIVKEPPLSPTAIEEMKQDQAKCQDFMIDIDENEQHSAQFYREKADQHLQNRLQLHQKAQQYYQRGMAEVAMFYSELARKETNYYDRANNLAASTFLNEHSKRLEKFDTLDLHFLYVKEAISALDLFIDQNINLLQHSTNNKTVQNLFIITGRGKRSNRGVARIKPAVISRLKKRKIKYVELNPGWLKIKVEKHSPITSDLS